MNQIHNMVSDTLDNYYRAFHVRDWLLFGSFLSEDFKYFTDKCIIQDKQSFLEFLSENDWMNSSYIISDLHIISSKENDQIMAMYTIIFSGKAGGIAMNIKATESMLFRKEKELFKICHCHSSNKVIG